MGVSIPSFLTWGCRDSLAASIVFLTGRVSRPRLGHKTPPPPFSIEKHPVLPPTLLAYNLFSLYHILGRICSVARALVPYPFIVPRSTS
jgi:hypothetical protein